MKMDRKHIEDLRERVSCTAVLARASFALDRRESTRRALKFRRADDIVIVVHEGRGWWDPLSEAKGDVFLLVRHLERLKFPEAVERVRELAGLPEPDIVFACPRRRGTQDVDIGARWAAKRLLSPKSSGWLYLATDRAIPPVILAAATAQGLLRQGPPGSAWMRHAEPGGAVVGWEERGATWRGFATGGQKMLFCFGAEDASRICVTEAAIDALSLAAIEADVAVDLVKPDTLYVSTGGGWSPATETALRALAPGRNLIAATDRDGQGEAYAARLGVLAAEVGATFARRRPIGADWNEDVRRRRREADVRQAGRPVQG